jgi:hypothetical protein
MPNYPLKLQVKQAFTKFPAVIVTYVVLAVFFWVLTARLRK